MRLLLLTPICVLVLTITVVTATSVHASLIVDNGTSTSTGGFSSHGGAQVFDDFTLSSTETLRAIAFEAVTAPTLPSISISVWSAPNSGLLHSADFAFGDFASTFNADAGKGRGNYTLSTDLPGWTLGQGTYWLSIYRDEDEYLLSPSSSGEMKQVIANTVHDRESGLPFRLYNSTLNANIPEPSTYLVFTGLILCFGLAGWWRKRNQAA